MRPDAPGSALIASTRTVTGMAICDYCGADYGKSRKSQRFCSRKCRQTYHNSYKPMAGPAGTVVLVRKIRTGAVSVTVHFVDDNTRRALDFSVGDTVLIGANLLENESG